MQAKLPSVVPSPGPLRTAPFNFFGWQLARVVVCTVLYCTVLRSVGETEQVDGGAMPLSLSLWIWAFSCVAMMQARTAVAPAVTCIEIPVSFWLH
jgi:uncharacterized membrane protein